MRVLIAEDDAMSRRLLQILLEQWGHEVVTAVSGVEAWELLERESFPMLITDWMMPVMDGLELIRRIRASERGGFIYILLLTAKTQKEDVVSGLESGADDYVTKPFDRDELRVRLRAGERIVRLEQALSARNRELKGISEELESRVKERTRDLARTNRQLLEEVAERKRGAKELEQAQGQLIRAEKDKREFYREVIRCVTKDKFHLVEREKVPEAGEVVMEAPLEVIQDYPELRKKLKALSEERGMEKAVIGDFILAVGEAATNTIKHATHGRCVVFATPNRLIARVEDRGTGIQPDNLAPTILMPGFSTQVSMGMGYTLMLELSDRVWLSTGPDGTQVQLEKWLRPGERPDPQFDSTLERFGDGTVNGSGGM